MECTTTNNVLESGSMLRKTFLTVASFAIAVVCRTTVSDAGVFKVIHSFDGTSPDSAYSGQGLIVVGDQLFGLATGKSTDKYSNVFKSGLDGSGFKVLHSFTFDDAAAGVALFPQGATLYGVARGISDASLFRIEADGSEFQKITSITKDFAPYAVHGSSILGTTQGDIYQLGFDGSSSKIADSVNIPLSGTGYHPFQLAGLSVIGDRIYCTMPADRLTVSMALDGSDHKLVFRWNPFYAMIARGTVTSVGSELYGIAWGQLDQFPNNYGFVYSMSHDGNNFKAHPFNSLTLSGYDPLSDFAVVGNKIVGMVTTFKPDGIHRELYSIGLDGSNFKLEHDFGTDHRDPAIMPGAIVGSSIYGFSHGDGENGAGTIFTFTVPEPSGLALAGAGVMLVALAWAIGGKRLPTALLKRRLFKSKM
jgi:hypothetical protein